MWIVTIEDRDGSMGRTLARFAVGGELPESDNPGMRPDLAMLVEVREAMFDYIKNEMTKAKEVHDTEAARATRDADLVSGLVDVQTAKLAEAEAIAGFQAAHKKKADDALEKARANLNDAKAKADK
jgi:hypothetical protein